MYIGSVTNAVYMKARRVIFAVSIYCYGIYTWYLYMLLQS